MLKCHICEACFKNNLGGQLTNHLVEEHDIIRLRSGSYSAAEKW